MDNAHGDFICFIDSDDYIHPQMLEVLMNVYEDNDCDFSMVEGINTYKYDNRFDTISDYNTEKLSQDDLINGIFSESGVDIYYQVVWNKLYPIHLVKDLRFIKTASEDTVFNTRLFLRVKKAIYAKVKLYYYVMRADSLSHMIYTKNFINNILSYHQAYNYLLVENDNYRGKCLYKMYKRMLNIRYYSSNTENWDYCKNVIANTKKETWKAFLSNKSISLKQKSIICIFFYFPSSYRLFMALLSLRSRLF